MRGPTEKERRGSLPATLPRGVGDSQYGREKGGGVRGSYGGKGSKLVTLEGRYALSIAHFGSCRTLKMLRIKFY